MNNVRTTIDILDKNLDKVATVKTFIPLDSSGDIIKYSKELSDFGTCTFRISSYDTLFKTYGDIISPHQYHIRVRRNNLIVWQGAIVENPRRNKDYVEVVAAEYLFYLSRKLIHRNTPDANGDKNIYRKFVTGTMADAVTAIMNETITDYQGAHMLTGLTLGRVDNPNFPPNTTVPDSGGKLKKLTGGWTFANTTSGQTGIELDYDFNTVLQVLKAFGAYTFADFEITNSLVFNFRSFLGNDNHTDIAFRWGEHGNVYDYNIPRLGQRMANSIIGIATTPAGVIFQQPQTDQASIDKYGLLEIPAAYATVETQATLNAIIAAELPLISTPDDTAASVVLFSTGNQFPTGTYDLGDIITIKVDNIGLKFNEVRRIVGITTVVHNTGREQVTVQTEKPQPWQYGSGV
jgi:hypothetical protein